LVAEAFEHTFTEHADLVEVRVRGRLDAQGSRAYLVGVADSVKRVAARAGPGTIPMLFIDELTWFEAGGAARAHGEWFLAHKALVNRIAIISPKAAMPLAASIGMLISRKDIKVFSDRAAALAWLRARA
jgi:hypothetical protein